MTDEKLTPERAVRLLRAKAGELEAQVLHEIQTFSGSGPAGETLRPVTALAADIALIAILLADYMERMEPIRRYAIAHGEHGVRGDPESMPPLVEARRDMLRPPPTPPEGVVDR